VGPRQGWHGGAKAMAARAMGARATGARAMGVEGQAPLGLPGPRAVRGPTRLAEVVYITAASHGGP
jgi:hypothetical protein